MSATAEAAGQRAARAQKLRSALLEVQQDLSRARTGVEDAADDHVQACGRRAIGEASEDQVERAERQLADARRLLERAEAAAAWVRERAASMPELGLR